MTPDDNNEKPPELNERQEKFCREYLLDLNATQAAIRAGYSETSAGTIGFENMRKHAIVARIQELVGKRNARLEITTDRILAEYARIGFASVGTFTSVTSAGDPYMDLSKVGEDDWAAISEVQTEDYVDGRGEDARSVKKVKVKMHDKLRALDAMAKHVGIGSGNEGHHKITPEAVAATLIAMQGAMESPDKQTHDAQGDGGHSDDRNAEDATEPA